MKRHDASLTTGSVGKHLVRLTIPMIGGMFAMTAFHLADTYFVSRLGTTSLAAISFTFPVIMVIGSIALGLGMGASAVISRAIGAGDGERVRRLATDSLLLGMTVVAVLAVAGLLTMRPLFRALGATDEVLPLIEDYMTLWYACVVVLIVPMIGNNCIRATGDTLTPGIIMMMLAGLNIILDPIFIFGYFGVPAMGIFGAALATVLSRAIGVVIAVYIMSRRCHLISWRVPALSEVLTSWKLILATAGPAALNHLLMPISQGIIVALVATYGKEAVAAVGAGGRLLHFFFMVPIALGSVLVPFIGQNWGSGFRDRVRDAWLKTNRFSLVYAIGCALVFIPLARPLSSIFSKDSTEVTSLIALFVTTVLITSGFQHIAVHTGFALNAIGRPMLALLVNIIRLLALMVPLAYLGEWLFGLVGIFAGLAGSQFLAGIAARLYMPRFLEPDPVTTGEPARPDEPPAEDSAGSAAGVASSRGASGS